MPDLVIFDCDGVLVDSELIFAGVLAECLTAADFSTTIDEAIILGFCGGGHCPDGHADRLLAAGCAHVFARMADLAAFLREE